MRLSTSRRQWIGDNAIIDVRMDEEVNRTLMGRDNGERILRGGGLFWDYWDIDRQILSWEEMKGKRGVRIDKEREESGMVRQFIIEVKMVVAVEVIIVK